MQLTDGVALERFWVEMSLLTAKLISSLKVCVFHIRFISLSMAKTKIYIFWQFYLTENVERSTICDLKLDAAMVKQFKEAVENSYWFEFFIGMFLIIVPSLFWG